MARIEIVDLEHGRPTADETRRRLETELALARGRGVRVLKLVHGYGSTGKGGRLRSAVRTALGRRHEEGAVGHVVFGEAWSIFDAAARALLDRYPELRKDRDLERGNPGITLVEIHRSAAR